MGLPIRISAVTLACRDLGRMAAFYRQFGWPEAPTSVAEHVVFQCANGVVLGLFSEPMFETRFGQADDGARGFALTVHVDDEAAVDRAHREVEGFDDVRELDPEPTRSGWGYGFGFRDPEGNLWGVADKFGSQVDDRGGFTYP
ncbi:MAG TPA: VOC family protein [Gaiellaceae bacterium]|nr:VOC family protein [Gaiellaceae bacterium]